MSSLLQITQAELRDVASFSSEVLEAYKEYLFPPRIRILYPTVTFSTRMVDRFKWVRSEPVKLFLAKDGWGPCDRAIESATIEEIKAYRNFLFPPFLSNRSIFSLDDADQWINISHFSAFLALQPEPSDFGSPLTTLSELEAELEETVVQERRDIRASQESRSVQGRSMISALPLGDGREVTARGTPAIPDFRSMSLREFLWADLTPEQLEQVPLDWVLGTS
ncbi:hypothetical protein GLOTRDRAFT_127240 [Gloeophyllum trabeum ATCC 11539]|uniref:Uncharacterized protein n=1 Tax=Gloeophyllum trabeum (strain ATCC 11539 / FP-39264 / Madison 617) TaxID=670483 RepID=S7QBV4_GLOTA|nr:uncharacterized protein GLOTRDRAFT_127240 [Gloeophyllum trabeum ATCC 11539]EPQ56843.1 hypothetical protein GLOTRDRAFT_127240 [Gloeophyllum trabeum ATCC 11539]